MFKKNIPLWSHLLAAGLVAAPVSFAVAEPVTSSSGELPTESSVVETKVEAKSEAPFTSQSGEAAASSAIAPALAPQLGFELQPVRTARVTDPQTAAVLAAQSIAAEKARIAAAATPKAPQTVAGNRSNEADLKLLAQLEAELNATESKLKNTNARLSAGQTQLVRVSSLLEKELLQGGPDSRGLHPFVRVAQRYAGTPYVWGGESARGFDCSGFIIRVMRDLGYKALPHSAAEQFRYGIPVATQNLRPGDLVFFANTYKPGISHVGIYLGQSRFIHAAGTGLGTIVSSLNEGKYRSKYAGARRLILQKQS